MNLTKFGVSAALISAIGYFAGYMSLIPVILLFIFVLYADMQVEVKKNLTQAVVLAAFFGILSLILSACSSAYLSFVNWLYEIASYNMMEFINTLSKVNIFNWLGTIVDLLEFGLMIYAIISSFSGHVVKLPIITKMVAKHFGEDTSSAPQNTTTM